MKIHSLGKTGLKVTNLCLGTMTFGNQADKKTSFEILDKAYDAGVGGMLTGRYRKNSTVQEGTRFALGNNAGLLYQERYWQEATFDAVERYLSWCQERHYDPVTTAVHWVTQQPGITSAIIGASRPEQLDASLRAADIPDLTMM